jgi:hypothetical protein
MIFLVEPKYIVSALCKAGMSVHQEIPGKMTAGMPMSVLARASGLGYVEGR